jgi:large repetitive protein
MPSELFYSIDCLFKHALKANAQTNENIAFDTTTPSSALASITKDVQPDIDLKPDPKVVVPQQILDPMLPPASAPLPGRIPGNPMRIGETVSQAIRVGSTSIQDLPTAATQLIPDRTVHSAQGSVHKGWGLPGAPQDPFTQAQLPSEMNWLTTRSPAVRTPVSTPHPAALPQRFAGVDTLRNSIWPHAPSLSEFMDLDELPASQGLIAQASSIPINSPPFPITAEGIVRVNGSSNFEGNPNDSRDDALIHGGRGFELKGNSTLPVQRDANGKPLQDSSGKQILVPNALTVAPGYTIANGPSKTYAGLEPPQIIAKQTVNVPAYTSLRTQLLTIKTPPGTPEVVFDARRTPRNAKDWVSQFPPPGTATQPTLVRVTNGGLTVPSNVNLNSMIVIVETGDIVFKGSGHGLNGSVLITNNGNIDLGKPDPNDFSALASGSITMSGGAAFGGTTLLANGDPNGTIRFDGSTKSLDASVQLQVISQGSLTFNGSSGTRGILLAVNDVTFNGSSKLYGAVGSQSNITFNGSTGVVGISTGGGNQPPTNLQLSNTTVAENVAVNSIVGTFTANNTGAAPVYVLATGTGDTDNEAFRIEGDRLLLQNSPDYEAKSTYSIRVRVTNGVGLSLDQVFPITITNVNEAPTAISLSNSSVAETSPTGTVIGTLSTQDPDRNDSFTYTLTNNAGGRFQIVGNQLQVANGALLDYETNASHTIEIRSTDTGGLSNTQSIQITVTDIAEAPTALTLSNTSIEENVPPNTLVGQFTATSPNASDTFTYTLVAGVGDTDNAAFRVTSNGLYLQPSPNFEAKSTYSIRARATNSVGLSIDKTFTITVTNVNEAPTAITLSTTSIAENSPTNSVIGRFSTTDPDMGDTFTYQLVTGIGSEDNSTFQIQGDRLVLQAVPDFEAKPAYSLRVQVTDAGGLSLEQSFTITVTNVNEAPTNLTLSNSTIAENSPPGTLIGTFITQDPDANDTFTYTLVDTAGGRFQAIGNQLLVANGMLLDYERDRTHTIEVRSTDSGGLSFSQTFTIQVSDVTEAPTNLILSNNSIAENAPANTQIGIFSTANPNDSSTYQLVVGIGDTDNAAFRIAGDQLYLLSSPNYETQSVYSIRVQATNAGGSFESTFTINVNNVNEVPSDITLSNNAVAENSPSGSVVGIFTTIDPDLNDAYTYLLINSAGDRFKLVGSQLQVADGTLDYERDRSHTIEVKSTDQGGLSITKPFTISVTNVSEAPISLALSNATVDENAPLNTVIGSFSAVDPDVGDTLTYTLVPGAGSTDNAAFQIAGNQLTLNAPLDTETQSSYKIRVRVTDQGGLSTEASFRIQVNNVNEAPTDLLLSTTSVPESTPTNTAIGRFTTQDPDNDTSFSYELVSGPDSTDNATFRITGDQLYLNAVPDFETQPTYSIRVQTTDSVGLSFEKVFTLSVTNRNEAPTSLTLTGNTVAENSPAGTVIGTFTTQDPDASDAHTYTLINDAAGRFRISGNQLQVADGSLLDYEQRQRHTIEVKSTDSGGLESTQSFTIQVTNVNEAPTNLTLSKTSIAENSPANAAIGQFSTTDPDSGSTFTYALVTGAGDTDNAVFQINGDQLFLTVSPDFETQSTYQMRVRSTDADGLSIEVPFTISVSNVNEAPAFTSTPELTTNADALYSYAITTTDPDAGDRLTISAALANGAPLPSWLQLTDNGNGTATLSGTPTTENVGSYNLVMSVTDAAGARTAQPFTLTVAPVNRPPTAIALSPDSLAENSPNQTEVGTLSTVDPDVTDAHTYTLLNDAGGRFALTNGNQVVVANGSQLDYEAATSYTIRVQTTDSGNPHRSYEQDLVITLTDVNEAPEFTSNPTLSGTTTSLYTYAITTADPENDARSITATLGDGKALPGWLQFIDQGNGTATLSGTPGFTDAGFYNVLLTVTDAMGASTTQSYVLGISTTLVERTDFNPQFTLSLTTPSTPSILQFKIDPVTFDRTDLQSINDAFEVALVDAAGNSLVHTIARDRDAFFNLTEGEPAALGTGGSYDAATHIVKLNLTGIQPNVLATVIFRLVNNDQDTTSQVTIQDVAITQASVGTEPPVQSSFAISPSNLVESPEFSQLVNVTPSFQPVYQQTSFNTDTELLYANTAIKNIGEYAINSPLLVAVDHISLPTVVLRNPDGFTPDGVPYYNFSARMADGKLNSQQTTESRSLVFSNPSRQQFIYDLIVLTQLNQAPVIVSAPVTEVIGGQPYRYPVQATDTNGDTLTYELSIAPAGMTIDTQTGLIQFDTTVAQIGNHQVQVQVSDDRGEVTKQSFTLSIITAPPNRPPVFTSTPVVDAQINTPYRYDADAIDPDQDTLSFSLKQGPEGMKVDSVTGEVRWTPPPVLVYGDTVLGRLTTPGEQDPYSFSGVSGQRLYYDNLISNGNISVQIYSPSGISIINQSNYEGLFTLPESGNYRLVINGTGSTTGDYGFSLIDLDQTPIAQLDTTITGVLSPGSEADLYRFSGNAGQRLYFDKLSSYPNLDWVVYGEGNQIITSASSWIDMEVVLPTDSNYVLALRGNNTFSNSGSYTFRIVTPVAISVPITLGTISAPNTIRTEITEKGEQDTFTFEGRAGQRVYFDGISSSGSNAQLVTLYSPSGATVRLNNYPIAGSQDVDPFSLPEDGRYRVVVDGFQENTGPYSFNLLDVGLADTVPLDVVQSATLSPGQATHLYKFTGQAGQRLYFDAQTVLSSTGWTLYNSGNQKINESFNFGDFEVTLATDDTYTLAIQGRSTTLVNYGLNIITPDITTTELVLGTNTAPNVVNTTIAEKGEQDIYTFSGQIGQRLYFDDISAAGAETHRVTLLSPSGAVVGLNNLFLSKGNVGPFSLPESGQYQLIIDGYLENIGTYSFALLDVEQATTISLDTNQTNSLNPGLATQLYKFTGTTGQQLYFDVLSNPANVTWTLFNSGNRGVGTSAFSDFEVTLSTNDTYILAIQGNSTTPVNYSFAVIAPDLVTTPLQVSSMSTPIWVDATIAKKGEQDSYTFTGTSGQKLYIDPRVGTTSMTVRIISPGGGEFFSSNLATSTSPVTLVESGSYRLIVDGQGETTGNYSFQLLDVGTAFPLSFGTSTGSQAIAPGEATLYQFTGTKGQRLQFDSLLSSSGGTWSVFTPGNSTGGTAALSVDFESTLPTDGVYILAVQAPVSTSTSYNIQINDLSTPAIANTGLGPLYSGSLAGGQQASTSFTAVAGTWIYLDSQDKDFDPVEIRLLDPAGTQVFSVNASNDQGPTLLPRTGSYTVNVRNTSISTPSDYSYRIVDLGTASSLGLNLATTAVLSAGQATIPYQFNGVVGQRLYYDSLSSTLTGTARLFSPSGNPVLSISTQTDSGLVTLTEAGTHYLLLSGEQASATSTSFRLLDSITASGLPFDTTVTGSYANSGLETDLYRFIAQAGQRIYLDTEGLGNAGGTRNTWVLYGPGGQVISNGRVFNPNGQSYDAPNFNIDSHDYEGILNATGEYLLAVQGVGTSDVNYSVHVTTPEITTIAYTLNSVASNSIAKRGNQVIYTFAGTPGQQLYYDGLDGTAAGLRFRLFSPSGVEVAGVDARLDLGSNSGLTLTEGGTYRAMIDGLWAATGNFKFRLLDRTAASALPYDTTVTGSYANGGLETDLYRFTAQAGQRIYLDTEGLGIVGSTRNSWVLYGPGGQVITNGLVYNPNEQRYDLPSYNSINHDYEGTLAAAGEYLLALQGAGTTNDFNYSVHLTKPEVTTIAYDPDSIATGVISKRGNQVIYTLTGTSGQQLFYDGLDGTASGLKFRLFSPSGVEVAGVDARSDLGLSSGLILTENGTYRAMMDGLWAATGNFKFRLMDRTAATTLPYDTTISSSYANGGLETDLYRFTAQSGQRIYLDTEGLGSGNPWLLYGPGGQVITSGSVYNPYGQSYDFGGFNQTSHDYEGVLAAEGEYLLAVQGKSTTNDLNYNVHVTKPEVTTLTYDLGSIATGAISKRGNQAVYTFTGTSGQQVYYDGLDGTASGLKFRLFSPSGVEVAGVDARLDLGLNSGLTLTESGTYRAMIDGLWPATGNFKFRLMDRATATTLPLDTTISGTYGNGGLETKFYRFTATVGQQVYLDTEGLGYNNTTGKYNTWVLYGPGGQVVSNGLAYNSYGQGYDFAGFNQNNQDFEGTLSVAGEYLLVLQGAGTTNNLTYSVHLTTPERVTNPLVLGSTLNGTISKRGNQNIYTFEGTAGQQLLFDALTGSAALRAKLYSPTDILVKDWDTSIDAVPISLTEPGSYGLVVDGNFAATGNYSFILSDRAQISPLVVNTAITGSLNPGNRIDWYPFDGTQGQVLNFDLDAPGWSGANWVLYDPSSRAIQAPSPSRPDFTTTLSVSGPYMLAVIGVSQVPVNYGFRVMDQTPAPVATTGLGTVQSGTLTPGQRATYSFTASTGTRIYVDSLGGTANSIQILNSAGVAITGASSTAASLPDLGPVVLPQAGTYTIQVQSSSSSTTNYQYQLLELPSVTPDPRTNENSLQLGIVASKTWTNGRTSEVYSFTGTTGQVVYLDWIAPVGSNAINPRLLSPSNSDLISTAGSGNAPDQGPYILPESGTYNLLLVGQQSPAVSYSFRMLDLAAASVMELNRRITGNLQPSSASELYQITGTAGQRLFFDSLSNTAANWVLYRPGDRKVLGNSNAFSSDFEVVLPADGVYTLAITGTAGATASYSFQVFAPKSQAAIVTPGTGESGASEPGLGIYNVSLGVQDDRGGQAEQNYRIRIAPEPGNTDPEIVSEAVTTGFTSQRYRYDVEAQDADEDTLTYTLTTAPSGMFINSDTRVISWASPIAGAQVVKVRVDDGRGGSQTQSFTLSISDTIPGVISGTVYQDSNGDGRRLVTNPGNLQPYPEVTIGTRFKDAYTPYLLKRPAGVSGILGPLAFKVDAATKQVDPNALLLGGGAASQGGGNL